MDRKVAIWSRTLASIGFLVCESRQIVSVLQSSYSHLQHSPIFSEFAITGITGEDRKDLNG